MEPANEIKEKVQKHKKQSIHYFENALQYIDAGDAEKASEFLWGSLTQALKAVAAGKGISLKTHDSIRKYALALVKALEDEGVSQAFTTAQSLHSNFYETGLLLDDVKLGAETVKKTISKLFTLIPEK